MYDTRWPRPGPAMAAVAALLDQEEWEINTRWAVCSGQFRSREEAEAHRQELTSLGVTPSFWKHVTRRD